MGIKSQIKGIEVTSKSYSTQFNGTISTGQFVISVNQPIFKMGGILEAIDYAKALGGVNELDIELQRHAN